MTITRQILRKEIFKTIGNLPENYEVDQRLKAIAKHFEETSSFNVTFFMSCFIKSNFAENTFNRNRKFLNFEIEYSVYYSSDGGERKEEIASQIVRELFNNNIKEKLENLYEECNLNVSSVDFELSINK